MRRAADVLYLLATFSTRSGFLEKATAYASAGYRLFPEDHRQVEMYGYVLILQQRYGEADEILSSTTLTSRNLEYLRTRVAILTKLPKSEALRRLRAYLAN